MIKKIIILLLLFIFLLGFWGCVSRKEIVKLKEQADYLERNNYKMETGMSELDSLVREQLKQIKKLRADMNSSFENVNERLNILENKLEEKDTGFYKVSTKKETPVASDTSKKEEKPDTTKPQINLDPEKLYKSAYLDLTKGNYDLAIMGFYDYLKYFPDEESAPKAQYWIGECFYAKGDFTRAVVEFAKVLEKYSKSDKVPSTLYKLGLSYEELKDSKSSKKYFDKLMGEYPQSPEAKLTKERQKKQ